MLFRSRNELLEEYNDLYYQNQISPQDILKEKNKQLKELSKLINILSKLNKKFKNIEIDEMDDGIKDYYNDIKKINPNNFTKSDINLLKGKRAGIYVGFLCWSKNNQINKQQLNEIYVYINKQLSGNIITEIYPGHGEDFEEIKMAIECSEEFEKLIKNRERRTGAPTFKEWLKSKGLKKYIKEK